MTTIHHGDCLDVLRELPDNSVDAIVTDPPYGLGFMGQKWDTYANETGRAPSAGANFDHVGGNHNPTSSADAARTRRVEAKRYGEWCDMWATEALRVLKPGGHMLAFGGTRTWHRLACAVEDAGFEVRDSIAWLYGSGFPKSLDVSKAIDAAASATREVVSEGPAMKRMIPGADQNKTGSWIKDNGREYVPTQTVAATEEAAAWEGWGTALKPAFEPIVVARKPLAGTVAKNVLEHGTGALNIEACRIETGDNLNGGAYAEVGNRSESASLHAGSGMNVPGKTVGTEFKPPAGRWPANVVLDESQAIALDEQSGQLTSGANPARRGADGDRTAYGDFAGQADANPQRGVDVGGASRFFYVAKADAGERPKVNGVAHPTVKPLDLMRWLVRLVTPPGGIVLDPFAGSGTTLEACLLEGFDCIGIEREADYLPLIDARLARRLDPVKAVALAGEDGGLFDLLEDPPKTGEPS